jgi:hypothetical protein
VAQDEYAELVEESFGQGADGYASRRFAGAGAFENVAGFGEVVFDGAGEVGVAGARAGDGLLLVFGAIDVFDGQDASPVFPVLVYNNDTDRRADGFRMANPADDARAIGFDFHAAAAAIALLAAPQFAIDGFQGHGDTGGQSSQGGDKALAM